MATTPEGRGCGPRSYGVSAHTIYAWKSKYGGMYTSEAQEAKRLRDENGRLRKLVADLSLDNCWPAATMSGLLNFGVLTQKRVNTSPVHPHGFD